MPPATRDSPRSRAAAAALAALHLPGAPEATAEAPPPRGWWAGVLVETAPGAAPRVAARLLARSDCLLCGGDGRRRLALVLGGAGPAAAAGEALRRSDPEILEVRVLRLFDRTPEVP